MTLSFVVTAIPQKLPKYLPSIIAPMGLLCFICLTWPLSGGRPGAARAQAQAVTGGAVSFKGLLACAPTYEIRKRLMKTLGL